MASTHQLKGIDLNRIIAASWVTFLAVILAVSPTHAEIQWDPVSGLSQARFYFGACEVGGKIYVIGGNDDGYDDGFASGEVYDPANDTWTAIAPMSEGRQAPAAAAYLNKLYVFGGKTGACCAANSSYDTVEVYDPAENGWSFKTPMPYPRGFFTATVVNDQIYLIGGQRQFLDNSPLEDLSRVDIYSPLNDQEVPNSPWTSGVDLPDTRLLHCAAALGSKIYLIGGNVSTGTTDSVLFFDTENPEPGWQQGPSLNTARWGAACDVVNGKIYVSGGSTGSGAGINTIEVLDPAVGQWTYDETQLPTSLARHATIAIDNMLYLVGGLPAGSGTAISTVMAGKVKSELETGLVAYYPFNGNADDESGNGNNGTANGATLDTDRFGNAGSAYAFDGTDDYIQLNNYENFNMGTNPFSISVHLKTTPGNIKSIFSKFSISNVGYTLNILSEEHGENEGKVSFAAIGGSTQNQASFNSSTRVTDGKWHHVVAVREIDGTLRLYIDGQIDASLLTPPLYNTDNTLAPRIGFDTRNIENFSGAIDDVRVYSRALSGSKVQELYSQESGFFEEIQGIQTNHASDWESFTINGETYLIVANAFDGVSESTASKIYKWNGSSFEEFQSISTNLARDWEFFTINDEIYLAVGNAKDTTNSVIYKWDGLQFVEYQTILTDEAFDWEKFIVDGETYIAVAQAYGSNSYNTASKIFKWNEASAQFEEFQSIQTSGALDWESFTIDGETYLAVANSYDGASYNLDSIVYKWNIVTSVFEQFQVIPTIGAQAWKSFSINGETYLAVANAFDGSTDSIDSKIYKWNGSQFALFQSIPTINARDLESFIINGQRFIGVANYANGSNYSVDSKMYSWNGTYFELAQSIQTNGAMDWKSLTIDGKPYIAVANGYDGSSFTINSKIYRWNGPIQETDSDSDTLPDWWEEQYFADLTHDGTTDTDSDGLTDLAEYQNSTNPKIKDSDDDGLTDGFEVGNGSDPNVAEGLVAYYPFDGNADDESGKGNNGSVVGAASAVDRFGSSDRAYAFQGTDYISLPSASTVLGENPSAWSYSVWFKATDLYRDFSTIFADYYSESGDVTYGVRLEVTNSRKIQVGIRISNITYELLSSETIEETKWVNATAVVDKAQAVLRLYINGQYDGEIGINGTADYIEDAPFSIGRIYYQGGTDYALKGVVDDLRIYNRALSEAEVQELYNLERDITPLKLPETLKAVKPAICGYCPSEGYVTIFGGRYNGSDTDTDKIYIIDLTTPNIYLSQEKLPYAASIDSVEYFPVNNNLYLQNTSADPYDIWRWDCSERKLYTTAPDGSDMPSFPKTATGWSYDSNTNRLYSVGSYNSAASYYFDPIGNAVVNYGSSLVPGHSTSTECIGNGTCYTFGRNISGGHYEIHKLDTGTNGFTYIGTGGTSGNATIGFFPSANLLYYWGIYNYNFHKFDIDIETSTALSYEIPHSMISGVQVGGKFILFGGGNESFSDAVYIWDPLSDETQAPRSLLYSDYPIITGTNQNPDTPATPSPANAAINQALDLTLTWTGSDPDAGDTVTYDVYVGTDSGSLSVVSSNQSTLSYPLTALSYGATYYWQIVAEDNNGAVTQGPVWSFTTCSDCDGDGMEDPWEIDKFGNTTLKDGTGDADSDGLTDLEEHDLDTNPNLADTDGDSMTDDWEIMNSLDPKTDDAGDDADGDRFTNGREFQDQTDPQNADDHLVFPQVTGRIADTGQTTSYTDTYGEDADYLINPPHYVKMDAQGRYLADTAILWAMVYDVVTGLIWEIKTDDGSIHDKDNAYTWYDSNPATNGGDAGTPGSNTDTEDFINTLNSEKFGSFSDWRMPTIEQLSSIVNTGVVNPAISTTYFPQTTFANFWSSTTYTGNTGSVWCTSFYSGGIEFQLKSNSYAARAVRARHANNPKSYSDNGDDTITDVFTGLMWAQKTDDGGLNDKDDTYHWENALSWIQNLNNAIYKGYNDWRLPNINELQTLIDYSRYNPSIDTTVFPNTLGAFYISSTTYVQPDPNIFSLFVNFFDGDGASSQYKTDNHYAYAVRGGQNKVPGNLYITAPVQASRWAIGSIMPITWETQDIAENVSISISRDGGKTYETIVSNTPNDGSHDWTVSGGLSVNCMLRVEPVTTTSKGTIQGLFTIGEGKFVEVQAIPTHGASDWESFTIDGETYLAVANVYDGSSWNIDSKIYKWNGTAFEDIQSILTNGAEDWEFFTIDGESYLAVGNYKGSVDSVIYKWNGSQFTEHQTIPTQSGCHWEKFVIDGETYIAVANYHDDSSFNIDSKIFKWNSGSSLFEELQSIPTNGAWSWESFSIDGESYIVVANSFNGSTRSIDSKIYRWNSAMSAFELFQSIPTHAAQAWKSFTIGGETYLAVANSGNEITNEIDSIIYKWNGSQFDQFQIIPTTNARDWESYTIDGQIYLAVAYGDLGTICSLDSKIYKWNGTNFEIAQIIPTNAGMDFESFTIDGTPYLAVANANDCTTHNTDSKIYKWRILTDLNQNPVIPSSPFPSNAATGIALDATLTWTGGDPDAGDTVTYDVYLGIDSGSLSVVSGNQTAISYQPSAISYGTTYYWQIVARDSHGAENTGPIWSFTTQKDFTGFTDAAPAAGVGDTAYGEWCSAWGDIDNDGDLDLAWTRKGGSDQLRRNNGDGTFTDISSNLGTSDGRGMVMGDYDNDGDLDIVVLRDGDISLMQNNGTGSFTNVASSAGISAGSQGFNVVAAFGDYDKDGDLDLYIGSDPNGDNILYRNNGNGTFTDVTQEAGVAVSGKYTGVVFFADLDNDGWTDLLLGDYNASTKNVLFHNNGDGTFSDTTTASGLSLADETKAITMSDIADIDNDGDLDLLVQLNSPTDPEITLFFNDGSGNFTETRSGHGLVPIANGEALFLDLNNDGHLDLYYSTNYPGNLDQVFINNGNGTFRDVSSGLNLSGTGNQYPGHPAGADYDNDGDLDLFLNQHASGYANQLLNNLTNDANCLLIDLKGTISNSQGIGAKVRVWKNGDIHDTSNLRGYRQVNANAYAHYMRTTRLHFGLDASHTYDIDIVWPSGAHQQLNNVSATQLMTITEPTVIVDTDGDGMADQWEIDNFGSITFSNGTGDADGDGLTDLEEHDLDTNPNLADTDGDAMTDHWEVLNSLDPKTDDAGDDADGDRFTNGREFQDQTDPQDADDHLVFPQDTGRIPDTGQTTSFTDTYGEDSDYRINPPHYVKMDAQGRYLADTAISWAMVYDVVTGLIWEVKTDDGSIHDKDNNYSWQNSADVFIASLNTNNFGGHSNWRLPSREELRSIIDFGRADIVVNPSFFPNTVPLQYWSSDTDANSLGNAWFIMFSNGKDDSIDKTTLYHVRAVRGGTIPPQFIDNNDGTITDVSSGLMWQRATDSNTYNWSQAPAYSENLTLAGHSDWRLPTIKELASIIDLDQYNPSIDTIFFPDTQSGYLSSTTYAPWTSDVWAIHFDSGTDDNGNKTTSIHVRSVRGGQNKISGNLYITSPVQASKWAIGSVMPIVWETQNIAENVNIKISRDGGKTYETIVSNTPNDGSHVWAVSGGLSVNCMLRVEPVTTTSKGTIQGLFTIGEGRFVEVQAIPTHAARDWESFVIDGETYLAVANSQDGSSFSIESTVYKWNGTAFEEIQGILTNNAIDWEFFTLNGESYLAIVNYDGTTNSTIYKWNGSQFNVHQSILTRGAYDWEFFTVGEEGFLAIANSHESGSFNIDSKIYKWNSASSQFDEFQSILTFAAHAWESFSIDGETYLAVANGNPDENLNIDSEIYKWNTATSTFDLFQSIPTDGAQDWESFTIDGIPYLVVANCVSNNVVIYKWNGSLFSHFQTIADADPRGLEAFEIDGTVYFAVSNPVIEPNHYNLEGTIYRWNGTSFESAQKISTNASRSTNSFDIDGETYLAVANQYDGTNYNIDSKIYKWRILTDLNQYPVIPSSPFPSNAATGIALDASLTWAGGDPDAGDTVTYDVYFGIDSGSLSVVSGNQTAISYQPSAISYGTTYYWQIVARDNNGAETSGPVWSFTTLAEPDITNPTAPTSLQATPSPSVWTADNTVQVSWTASTDAGTGVAGYSYVWNATAATDPDNTVDTTQTTVTSAGLTEGNMHYFHVRTVDHAGNASSTTHIGPFQIDVSAAGVSPGISGSSHTVSVCSSDSTIDITWTPADGGLSGIGGYSVVWDANAATLPASTVNAAGNTMTSQALTPGSAWYAHVRAVDGAGNWSEAAAHFGPFCITDAPAAPQNLTTALAGSRQATLRWDYAAQAPDLAGYNIYRSDSETGFYVRINSFPVNQITLVNGTLYQQYTDTGLVNGITYWYKVTAANGSGVESGFSNAVSALPNPRTGGDFRLTADESYRVVTVANIATFDITVWAEDRFAEAVTLHATSDDMPSGVIMDFSHDTVQPTGSTSLMVTVPYNTETGEYTIKINALSATRSHETYLTLKIISNTQSCLTALPASATFRLGNPVIIKGQLLPTQPIGTPLTLFVRPAGDTAWAQHAAETGSGGAWKFETHAFAAIGQYEVKARWEGNSTYAAIESDIAAFTVEKGLSELSVTTSTQTIDPGVTVSLEIKLMPALEGYPFTLEIFKPGIDTPEAVTGLTTGPNGITPFVYFLPVDQPGVWKFKAVWAGNDQYIGHISLPLMLYPGVEVGEALIVAGGGLSTSNTLWDTTEYLANRFYTVLKGRRFTDAQIHYLNPSPVDYDADRDQVVDIFVDDRTPASADVQAYIERLYNGIDEPGTDPEVNANKPLIIYLTDHGGDGKFRMNAGPGYEDNLLATDLDTWLDDLQAATGSTVVVIVDACYSGSFISRLAPEGVQERILISSSAVTEPSIYLNNGMMSFTQYLSDFIKQGYDLRMAFFKTVNQKLSRNSYFSHQNPQMDDGVDGTLAGEFYVGGSFVYGDVLPEIIETTPGQVIDAGVFNLMARVSDLEGMDSAWVTLMPPGYTIPTATQEFETPIIDLESVDLTDPDGDSVWEGSYDFRYNGTYTLTFFARDTGDNVVTHEVTLTVVNGEDPPVPGDLNADGTVDLKDAVIAVQAVVGIDISGSVPAGYATAGVDVNGDGKIGLAEAVYILQTLAFGSVAP